MHSTVAHRHQGATPSRYPDVDHGLGIVPDSAVYGPQICADSLVTGVGVWNGQRWRWHPADKGSFAIRGDAATWTFNDRTHMAPLEAIGNVSFKLKELPKHSNIRTTEKDGRAVAPVEDADVTRRFQVLVNAFAADELERATDDYGRELNKWQCPTHDDEVPSLSINPDFNTGYILAKCHSGGDECGNGDADSRRKWLRELSRLLDIPHSTWFPSRRTELPPDHEPAF